MRRTSLFILIAVLGIAGMLFFGIRSAEETPARDIDRVIDIPLRAYDGTETSLRTFVGTPLVINSWAVWCPFCREELPDFARLKEEYGEQIKMIAINRAESVEGAQSFTDSLSLPAPILFLMDQSDTFYRAIGGFAMPETLFMNAAGDIVVHKRGFMDLEEMRRHTDAIITSSSAP